MNLLHNRFCQSAAWRRTVSTRIPWALDGVPLGRSALELGPGFGVTTEIVSPMVETLTCIEINPVLADRLARRFSRTNVVVRHGDATRLEIASQSVDTVLCFTMLHHIPSPRLQDQLIGEAARVLNPGGYFAGIDSLAGLRFRVLHILDTMTLVDPRSFKSRLLANGFDEAEVECGTGAFRFRAHKATKGG